MSRKTIACALAGVAAVLAVAACGTHPLIPSSVTHHRPAGPSPWASATAKPVTGVDLYAQQDYAPAVAAADGARDLTYLRGRLHANAVGIVWNFYTPSNRSDAVEDTGITFPVAEVAELTRQAEADGLTVQYRPLIRVGRREKWEGAISPADQAAWFASLWRAERPYLRLAKRLHVSQFVVASEMEYMNNSPGWAAFLARARAAYPGQVTLSLWDGDYFAQHIPGGMGAPGVDPYPDTGLPDRATQAQVTAAWHRLFAPIPAAVREATTLDEVGFIAEKGAYSAPQEWHRRTPSDYRMQARWFTAVCRTAAAYHLAGVYFYDLNLAIDPNVPDSFPGFFAHRPGARAIAGCAEILRH